MEQIVIEVTLLLVVEDVVNGFIDVIAESDEDVAVATSSSKLRNEGEILHTLLRPTQLLATEEPWQPR